ncbi:MAG: hypothetical protein M3094_06840 [Actinomycetia bacterium]|nr:hypothetical protein [Actinomycetes bacterium]
MQHETTTDYPALIGIARAAVSEISSPSARFNITDAIASRAVEQYLEAVERGDDIRNPHGWVQVTARKRAIDAMIKWGKEKKRNHRVDVDERATQMYIVDASNRLVRYVDAGNDAFGDVNTGLWIDALIESAVSDPVNREIAVRCLVVGEKPGDVAADLGLEAPVVSSRLARLKVRLKNEISIEDLRD